MWCLFSNGSVTIYTSFSVFPVRLTLTNVYLTEVIIYHKAEPLPPNTSSRFVVTSWKIYCLGVSSTSGDVFIHSKEPQINLQHIISVTQTLLDNSHHPKVQPHLQLCVHRYKYITPVAMSLAESYKCGYCKALAGQIIVAGGYGGIVCPYIQLLTAEKPGTKK